MKNYSHGFNWAFDKRADYKINPNPDLWVDDIYTHIYQQHPYLSGTLQGDVDWSESPVDEMSGSGAGYITALVENTPIRIPVFVDDFQLKPIDIFLSPEGRIELLDEDAVSEYISPVNVMRGEKIPSAEVDSTSWLGKMGSYPNAVSDFGKTAKRIVANYPALKGSVERIKTAMSGRNDNQVVVCEDIGGSYRYTYYDRGEKKLVKSASMTEAFEQEDLMASMARAATHSEKKWSVYAPDHMEKNAFVLEQVRDVSINPGQASIAYFNGEKIPVRGFEKVGFLSRQEEGVMPVVDIEARPPGNGVALSLDYVWKPVQQKMASELVPGDEVFMLLDHEKIAGPMRVSNAQTSPSGESVLKVTEDEAIPHTWVLSKMGQKVVSLTGGKSLIPAQHPVLVMKKIARKEEKTASASYGRLSQDRNGQILKLDGGSSYGGRTFLMSEPEMAGRLMSMGVSHDDVKIAMHKLGNEEDVDLANLNVASEATPYSVHLEKTAWHDLMITILRARDPLTKCANALADNLEGTEEYQDSLMIPNAVNQFNIDEFVANIDVLEDAKDMLGNLLVAIRKSEVSIDEDAVKNGLVSLEEITDGIQDIE